MDLTDQYLQYLRDTKQYNKLDRHFAGYPEEKENEPRTFLGAMGQQFDDDEKETTSTQRDENWLNDGDNPYDFDNDTDTKQSVSKQQTNTNNNGDGKTPAVGVSEVGFVRLFRYPNIPAGKVAIRFCKNCKDNNGWGRDLYNFNQFIEEYEYPDGFTVSNEMRELLDNETNGNYKEIANNIFIVSEQDWKNNLSRYWHVCWDYEEDFLADENGDIDIRVGDVQDDDGGELTQSEIEQMDDDEVIMVWIWDGNLESGKMTDWSPRWLYEWMENFFEDSESGSEEMESLFDVTVRDYKRLIEYVDKLDKDTRDRRNQSVNASIESSSDDEEREYDDDPYRYGGSSTRWNAHMPIKTQQLQAPKGGREHLKAIFDDVTLAEFILDDDFDARHPGLPSNKMVRQDMDNRITWSAENANPEDRYGTTKTGIDYISVGVGLDYGLGFDVFLYWDGQNIRAYIPWRGNCLDTVNKCMLCGDDDNSEYFNTYVGDIEDIDDLSEEDTNYDMCLEEFEAQFDPSIAIASKNQQSQTNTSKQQTHAPKKITYDYLMDVHKNQKSHVYFKWNEHLQPSNTKLSAPKGGADHLEFFENDTAAYWFVNVRDTKELKHYHGLSNINFPSNAKVHEDLKSFLKHYDSEDGDVKETGTTSNGIDYVAMEFSAGNNPSFYVFFYWDGNDVRAYVPYKGNCIDTIEQRTFDGDESVEYVVKYLYPQIPEYIPGRTLTDDEEYEVYNFIAEAYYEDDMEPNYQTCYKDFESKFGYTAPQ